MTSLTKEQVKTIIRKAVDLKGGPEKFARYLDVTPEYVAHIMRGKKPGPKVLKHIGVTETGGIYRAMENKK